jgi:hypothetical protein
MTIFYVAIVLMVVSVLATGVHLVERYACEAACSKDVRVLAWAHIAVERIYYLRTQHGWMLYVGQTVNEDRRWDQHAADGVRKENWKALVYIPASTVVRYCWTYRQSMRIERRRTLSIFLCFAVWEAAGSSVHRQIHNISNTPRDTRRGVKPWEWAVAAVFLPFYFLEGWFFPEAQWATPVTVEQLS